jgi:hypothetical protein
MLKIESKSLNLVVKYPIQFGELKVVTETMVWVHKNTDGTNRYDADFIDISDITYMGIPIHGYENWKKFKKFHLDMGIDYMAHIDARYKEAVNSDSLWELVKDLKF